MLAWHSAMAEETLASTPVLSTAMTDTLTAVRAGRRTVPLHLDQSLPIIIQRFEIWTIDRMDRQSPSPGNVAKDPVAGNWIAAPGQLHQDVSRPLDLHTFVIGFAGDRLARGRVAYWPEAHSRRTSVFPSTFAAGRCPKPTAAISSSVLS